MMGQKQEEEGVVYLLDRTPGWIAALGDTIDLKDKNILGQFIYFLSFVCSFFLLWQDF